MRSQNGHNSWAFLTPPHIYRSDNAIQRSGDHRSHSRVFILKHCNVGLISIMILVDHATCCTLWYLASCGEGKPPLILTSGMVGPAANIVCLLFVDKWGRKRTMWITGIVMACDMALIMGFTAGYAHSNNKVGQGFTIAFIFCFSIM